MLTKINRKNLVFGGRLREHKNNCKNEHFRENFHKNQNFSGNFSQKQKLFAKTILGPKILRKNEYFRENFHENRIFSQKLPRNFCNLFSRKANKNFPVNTKTKKFSFQPYPAMEPHGMMRLRNADCCNDDYCTATGTAILTI
jgi:hypothetical protein